MVTFALSSIPKGSKNAHLISPASEACILVRMDSFTLFDYRTKKLFVLFRLLRGAPCMCVQYIGGYSVHWGVS